MIAQALDAMGIDELEVGIPAMGGGEIEDIHKIANMGLCCHLSVWCRARIEDLEAAVRCDGEGIHISLPVSDIHLDALGKSRQWVCEQLYTLVPPSGCGHYPMIYSKPIPFIMASIHLKLWTIQFIYTDNPIC